MTWRAALHLPDDAAAKLEEIARGWGVQPAVAARIGLMQWLRIQTPGEPPPIGEPIGSHEELPAREHEEPPGDTPTA